MLIACGSSRRVAHASQYVLACITSCFRIAAPLTLYNFGLQSDHQYCLGVSNHPLARHVSLCPPRSLCYTLTSCQTRQDPSLQLMLQSWSLFPCLQDLAHSTTNLRLM